VPFASEWCDWLREAIQEFGRTRRSHPVVQLVLDDGETFFVQSVEPAAGNELVMLAVYPDVPLGQEMLAAMVRDEEGDYHTARVVIVHPARIQRTELLVRAPGEGAQPFGFTRPDE
jgi:hypothetical protein